MKTIMFLICIVLASVAGGQAITETMPRFKDTLSWFGGHITQELLFKFKQDTTMSINACGHVRFRVNEMGKIAQLEFSQGFDPLLKTIIINVSQRSTSEWWPKKINGKPVLSEYFLMPIAVSYNSRSDTINTTVGTFAKFEDEQRQEIFSDTTIQTDKTAIKFHTGYLPDKKEPVVYYYLPAVRLRYEKYHRAKYH